MTSTQCYISRVPKIGGGQSPPNPPNPPPLLRKCINSSFREKNLREHLERKILGYLKIITNVILRFLELYIDEKIKQIKPFCTSFRGLHKIV